ncbi:MAG: leucine-rich repeat protein [Clostridia bacterium]|nr:leucine-rich repeat protein [Clostridia bacterium]
MKKKIIIISVALAAILLVAAALALGGAAGKSGTLGTAGTTAGTAGTEAPLCSLMGRGHVYFGGVCAICGAAEPGEESRYFNFVTLADGTYAVGAGGEEHLPAELILPSEYYGIAVTHVLAGGFAGCDEIERVVISENVKTVGAAAFENCKNLKSAAFEGSELRTVEARAFYGCESLASVCLPQGLRTLGISAFGLCSALESIDMPAGLLYIGGSCFKGCASLESVVLPQGLRSISNNAFEDCTALAELSIPASVTSIGTAVFDGCGDINVTAEEGGNYASAGGCLIDKEYKTVIFGTGKSEIPADGSVNNVGVYAFCNRKDLTSIVLPAEVTQISQYAFAACVNLETAELCGVVTIGAGAFIQCESLESIVLPASVQSIHKGALDDCRSLTSIIYGGTVEQWHAIEKYDLRGAVTVYCTDGEIIL